MYEIFTYGRFEVARRTGAFVKTWTEFASWASARPGAGTIRLFRDVRNPGRFVSLGQWDNAEGVQAGRAHPSSRSGSAGW